MGSVDDLPGRGPNHAIEEKAESAFQALLARSEHFILQRADRKDYGTDCQIEVLDQGKPTNVRLHVQLKGTERPLKADGSLSISVQRTNLNYLLAQPYSVFVAYHLPTFSLRIATVESVLRHYEHEGLNWTEQDTLTVTFAKTLTLGQLKALAGLARSGARVARDRRLDQIRAAASDLPRIVQSAAPPVHVPDDPALASQILNQLYERGADVVISAAFDQFAAVLDADDDAMGPCYMAEINLGMAGRSQNPKRIEAGITQFRRKLTDGRYQAGSLHYTIGNAFSALGDEIKAKLSYQAAAGDMDFMADPAMAAQCLKNLGSSFERLGDEEIAVECYRGALEMNPELPEAHHALGHFHHRNGRFAEAIDHYDQVIFTEQQLGSISAVVGWRLNALFSLGETREAFRSINLLLASADREPWIWPWCARQVAAFGRTSLENAKGALAFWRRHLSTHSDVSPARAEILLTTFYIRQEGEDIGKDYAAFRAEFDDHIAYLAPEYAALPWDRLGHWAQDESNWEEAERCFRMAYEIEGGHYGYCLGTALNFLGRFGDALPLVQAQADGIQPDAMSWFQVAVAQEHLSNPQAAVEAYCKALILDPGYALAMFNMAGTLWNSGDHDRAVIIFRTAAQQFPDHDLTAKLRRNLPQLF
ncbi:DUF4365 domain-containing protein [Agrobacterium sp. CCNWLW71]|uniref:DUF4365 domain-containing protein n=1 Tax=unclassified Agrobacterium TaxID=2632611 RepID=UPI002FEF7C9A